MFDPPIKQQCNWCKGWYDQEVMFRKNPRPNVSDICATTYRPVCIPCEQMARDKKKNADPFLVKARSTIHRHAKRYQLPDGDFIARFGWDVIRVAHLLRHAFENTCEYCRKPYKQMRNGEWDVTMDVLNPNSPPYLETNTKVCCQTCNREKSNTAPELWARKLRGYAEWEENQHRRGPQPFQRTFEFNS